MNFLNGYPVAANGNITVSSFVDIDATAQFRVKQSGTGSRPVGISQIGPQTAPGLVYGLTQGSTNPVPYAATAGKELEIFGPGDICWLMVGTGGGVTAGDFLKPDAQGNALTTTTPNDIVAAQTFQSGNAGNLVVVVSLPPLKY